MSGTVPTLRSGHKIGGKIEPLQPDVLDAFLKKGTELHGAGRFDEAARFYQHVRDCNPEALAAPYFHALMDVEVGYLDQALERLRYVVRRDPNALQAQYALAYVFEQLGRWQQAADGYRRAMNIPPGSTAARAQLASVLEVLGRLDEAIAEFRKLTDDPRTRPRALLHIASIKPSAISAAEQDEIAAVAADPERDFGLRVGAYFSLGDLYERQRRYDDAFAAFAAANRMRREKLTEPVEDDPKPVIEPPSARARAEDPDKIAERHANVVARNIGLFTPELFARHQGKGHASRAPIFIVGMPRSGSTLIEQILASHPKVEGLGECGAIHAAVQAKYPYQPNPPDAENDPEHFRRMADDYLTRLRALGWGKSPRVIDKMLGNYMHIGMIALMFPHAIILNSVRDPVDTCLACFRKLFRSGNELTYDLADVGALYVRYRQMMAHWDAVLPDRVITVSHEELVADPERRIRWLVTEACGLKWDEACLRFHATKRAVRTASVAQVRQPIFSTSIARWRRYERHLGPLFAALGPYAPAEHRAGHAGENAVP
jgi:tetratricopeptide (TPR) repeat protein